MPISPISKIKTIAYKLDLTNDIKTIYSTNLIVGNDYLPGYKIISFNAFIKNLKAFASIESVQESELPKFLPTDTSTDKTIKVLDIEWKSPRKQLNLYIATNTSSATEWHQVGSLSLLNPYGYPFRIYNLMDLFTDNLALELGENSKLGIQVQNVGYGLLTPEDNVIIHGSYTEEIFVQTEDKPNVFNIAITNTGGGGNSGGGTVPVPNTLINNSSLISNTSVIGN